MDEKYPDDVQSKNYQDYITFKPQAIVFLSEKATDLVHEHSQIIGALRKKPMTVKEIHNLYFNIEKNRHSKAIKTIYRYLEKLEEENLVIVAGHRITEGVRVAEKLYARTANIFLSGVVETERLAEERENHAQIITKFFSTLFQLKNSDQSDLEQLFLKYLETQQQLMADLYNLAKENDELVDFFAKTDLNTINHIINLTASIGTFLHSSEVLIQLNDFVIKDR